MKFKKLFNRIFGIKDCPIPHEYQDKLEHIILCSGECTKCFHWKDYQLESYKKEAEEYISAQAKIIADLNQKLEASDKEKKEIKRRYDLNLKIRLKNKKYGALYKKFLHLKQSKLAR